MLSRMIRGVLWREAPARRNRVPLPHLPSLHPRFPPPPPPPPAANDRILLTDPLNSPGQQQSPDKSDISESQELKQTILEMRKRRDFTGEVVEGSKVVRNRRRALVEKYWGRILWAIFGPVFGPKMTLMIRAGAFGWYSGRFHNNREA